MWYKWKEKFFKKYSQFLLGIDAAFFNGRLERPPPPSDSL
jgi:hypothetical protein